MGGFSRHSGTTAILNEDHIDTDRIIPARFLTMVTRNGYGDLLFKDVRGPEFPLDQQAAKGASILVVGSNFGCGSSREHAVWAIQQAGFKAVIARKMPDLAGFSDIFRQNAANCGLLLIELEQPAHDRLASAGQGAKVELDLENQTISIGAERIPFEISPTLKRQHLLGLDLIGTTLIHEKDIAAFEREKLQFVPGREA